MNVNRRNHMSDVCNFGWALTHVIKGDLVARAHWDKKWIGLMRPDDQSDMGVPYLYQVKDKKMAPYHVRDEDLFATDWVRL
jgi:hypothetical protein